MTENKHISIMTKEVIENIPLINHGVYVDATLGGGGHTISLIRKLLSKNITDFVIHCYDLDKVAWEIFKNALKLEAFKSQDSKLQDSKPQGFSWKEADGVNLQIGTNGLVIFHNENFTHLQDFPENQKFSGIIADLGPSQNLLEREGLGLSYRETAALDMRLDKNLAVTAADLLRVLGKKQLNKLFSDYADIKYALSLAELIVDNKHNKPILTTQDLNNLVIDCLDYIGLLDEDEMPVFREDKKFTYSKVVRTNLARVYQALRIAVNLEYVNLESFLGSAVSMLDTKGKLLVIIFHSGEQKILSKFIKITNSSSNKRINNKVITPSQTELNTNNRSRSAKLNCLSYS